MSSEKRLRKIKQRLFQYLLDYSGEQRLPTHIESAVIFIARHIGDTMATYPIIRALQAANVRTIILVVHPSSYAALAPLEAEGITVYRIPHDRDKRAIIATARQIKRSYGQIDLCVQAMMRDTTATLLFQHFLKARCNLGLHHSSLRMYLPRVAEQATAMIEAQIPAPICWAQLMKDAGIANVVARFELPIPIDIEQSVYTQVAHYGPYIALNMDASQEAGSLQAETAIRLIEEINAAYSYQIVITCSPDGEEKANRVVQACPMAHVIAPPRSIYHSAAIIKHAVLVISPDTSIVHIASAYNRPTIGLYRVEAPAWRPLADQHATLITGSNINDVEISAFTQALQEMLPQQPRNKRLANDEWHPLKTDKPHDGKATR